MPKAMRLFLILSLALIMSGCGGGSDLASVFSANPPPATSVNSAEQARLRLTDACMFELAKDAGPMDKTAPRCQCYARTVLKQMSSAETASYASSGMLPFSVNPQAAMNSCRRARGA